MYALDKYELDYVRKLKKNSVISAIAHEKTTTKKHPFMVHVTVKQT